MRLRRVVVALLGLSTLALIGDVPLFAARCTPLADGVCHACSSCRYCAHCKNGGKCSICS